MATAPYLLFLNSDAEVATGAVDALAACWTRRPDVAIVGPRTVNGDGTAQVSFGPALTPLAEWRQRRLVRGRGAAGSGRAAERARALAVPSEPDWVSGSCLLIRRRAFDAVCGFDEGFFLYEEDVDLCVRVRAAGGASASSRRRRSSTVWAPAWRGCRRARASSTTAAICAIYGSTTGPWRRRSSRAALRRPIAARR